MNCDPSYGRNFHLLPFRFLSIRAVLFYFMLDTTQFHHGETIIKNKIQIATASEKNFSRKGKTGNKDKLGK